MNVEVTPLPGIGVRKDFALRDGRRIGVISYRDGKLELIVSKTDDPDACVAEVPLSHDEAGALANLLGAPQLVAHLNEEQRDMPGPAHPADPGQRGHAVRRAPAGRHSPALAAPASRWSPSCGPARRTRARCPISS